MGSDRYQYIVFFAILACAVIAGILLYRKTRSNRVKWLLSSRWGEASDRKFTANELALIQGQAAILAGDGGFAVDNITWNDLDMDKLYTRANMTYTNAGDHALYGILRNPLTSVEELQRRNSVMAWAKANPRSREKIKRALYDLGRIGFIDVEAIFDKEWFSMGRWVGCIALCSGFILGILLCILGVGAAVIPTLLIGIANSIIALRASAHIGSYINIAQYMPSVLLAARRIAAEDVPELATANSRIRELLARTKGVLGNGIMAYYNSFNDPTNGMFIFKMFFLAELIGFYKLAHNLNRYREEILDAYRIVGEVDALISAASWRESLEHWCEPELDGEAMSRRISFADLAHPMLREPVTNSVDINSNMLLTGSNATGKSTFLKTVALNAILAQSLYTCTAGQWRGGFFRVYTSMALRDDLFSHESYFITEIKSLKRMLDSTGGDVPSLCIVDEVLRGTNTGERIAAASEALLQFSASDCLCLAATHDIELTYILEGLFENMHFTETILDEGITFDYKIRPGRSQSRNAIRLLGLLGYGKELVDAANARLESFEKTGQWRRGREEA
jgi:hypothetical protein